MISDNRILKDGDVSELDEILVIFDDANTFSQYIERKAVATSQTCTSLVLDFCERRSLDVDDITYLIARPLKEKIKLEMIKMGMHKKDGSTLDDVDG